MVFAKADICEIKAYLDFRSLTISNDAASLKVMSISQEKTRSK